MKGQSWTLDFAVGLLIFLLSLGVVYGLFLNNTNESKYSQLQADAYHISDLIMSPGYPETWDGTDIIRAGLLFDQRLSNRKLELLTTFSNNELKNYFNTDKNFAFFIKDINGTIIPINNECYVGSELPTLISNRTSKKRLAYFRDSKNDLQSFVSTNDGVEYVDFESLYQDRYFYDLFIFEDPELINVLNQNLTQDQLALQLKDISIGGTIILLGNISTPILGINTSFTNGSYTVINDDDIFNLNSGIELNLTDPFNITFLNDDVVHKKIFTTNPIAAKWQYGDSLIYYFGSTSGLYGSDDWELKLKSELGNLTINSEINCSISKPVADNIVFIERLIPERGRTRLLNLYVWD